MVEMQTDYIEMEALPKRHNDQVVVRGFSKENQGALFTTGFTIFLLSNLLFAVGHKVDPAMNSTRYDRNYWTDIAWATCQTVGLVVMTLADVDVNRYLATNPVRLTLLLLIWAGYYLFMAIFVPAGHGFALAFFPFCYLALRFEPVVHMHQGHLRLTEIFTLILALDLIAFAFGLMVIDAIEFLHITPPWPGIVVMGIFGPASMLFVHRWSRQTRKESHTISFNTTVFVYLFSLGAGVLVECAWFLGSDDVYLPVGVWAIGVVHLCPTLTMLLFRQTFHKELGMHWLKHRDRASKTDGDGDRPISSLGNLAAVEDAITNQRDLNGHWEATRDDSYTLLHLAVWGERLDSVQRLMTFGGVDIDKGSKVRNWTALFIACKCGLLICAEMLLEYGADCNVPTTDGQTCLIIAAHEGHAEVVQLLMRHGADTRHRWMSLTAEDVAAKAASQHAEGESAEAAAAKRHVERATRVIAVLRGGRASFDRGWGGEGAAVVSVDELGAGGVDGVEGDSQLSEGSHSQLAAGSVLSVGESGGASSSLTSD
jgi:hypothetical protein